MTTNVPVSRAHDDMFPWWSLEWYFHVTGYIILICGPSGSNFQKVKYLSLFGAVSLWLRVLVMHSTMKICLVCNV